MWNLRAVFIDCSNGDNYTIVGEHRGDSVLIEVKYFLIVTYSAMFFLSQVYVLDRAMAAFVFANKSDTAFLGVRPTLRLIGNHSRGGGIASTLSEVGRIAFNICTVPFSNVEFGISLG